MGGEERIYENEISVKLEDMNRSWVPYNRSILEMLTQQVTLSRGDSLVPRLRCRNVENSDKNQPKIALYFGDICDTLNRELIGNENKEMVWKERKAVDGQMFVWYVQSFSD